VKGSKATTEVKEVFRTEVVTEKKRLAPLHACLGGKIGICHLTKLWYKVDRDMTMVKGDNGTHGVTVGTSGFLQYIHASDQVWDKSLTREHADLGYNIEAVDICKIEGKL
jgi:hypothetical protein